MLVIGDIANIPAKDGKTYPQLGSVALQSGGQAANTILAEIKGDKPKPFHYHDKGTMAMIGRGAAVAQVKGVELHGKLAFTAWLGVHAALMTGGSNRVERVQELGDRLLRQGAGAGGARPERHAADGVGRGRCRRDGGHGGRAGMTSETRTSTSSSSAAARAAGRWPGTWRRPESES